jgi:hypothetical protein
LQENAPVSNDLANFPRGIAIRRPCTAAVLFLLPFDTANIVGWMLAYFPIRFKDSPYRTI